MFTPRLYQLEGIEGLRQAVRDSHRRIVLQLPTGGGKTVIAGTMILRTLARSNRCLFTAHRLELLSQPYKKLLEAGLDEQQMSIRAGNERKRRRPDAPLQIASIGSLKTGDFAGYDLIFIDEAHRAACKTYLDALASADPDTIIIGLTATPERLDGKGLATAGFTAIVVAALPSFLIEQGYIIDPSIWTVPDEMLPDLSNINVGEDCEYSTKALAKATNQVQLVGSIVEHYGKRAQGLAAIAFAVDVPHSMAIVDSLKGAGIRAVHVDGNTRKKHREQALIDLRDGRIDVVSQCDLWIEGLDEPRIRVGIFGKPTQSLTRHLQMCGRVMRPYYDYPAIILDHAGNTLRLGLPSEDRVYSLQGRPKGLPRESSLRRCKTCFLIVKPSAVNCPGCGELLSAESRVQITYSPQQLRKLDPEGYKHYFFNKLWLQAYDEGNLAAWVRNQYTKRFNAPPQGWQPPTRPPIDESPEARKEKRSKLYMIAKRQGLGGDWVDEKMKRIYGTT